MAVKTFFKAIKEFVKTFPTATILYLLLVFLTPLEFDIWWFLFAIIIDLLDDFIAGITP